MALKNLKREMAASDVTVEAIADAIKVHRNTAANKIDGVTKITFDEAVAIRDKFFPGIGLEYLYQNE